MERIITDRYRPIAVNKEPFSLHWRIENPSLWSSYNNGKSVSTLVNFVGYGNLMFELYQKRAYNGRMAVHFPEQLRDCVGEVVFADASGREVGVFPKPEGLRVISGLHFEELLRETNEDCFVLSIWLKNVCQCPRIEHAHTCFEEELRKKEEVRRINREHRMRRQQEHQQRQQELQQSQPEQMRSSSSPPPAPLAPDELVPSLGSLSVRQEIELPLASSNRPVERTLFLPPLSDDKMDALHKFLFPITFEEQEAMKSVMREAMQEAMREERRFLMRRLPPPSGSY